jgi:hypothetical protein
MQPARSNDLVGGGALTGIHPTNEQVSWDDFDNMVESSWSGSVNGDVEERASTASSIRQFARARINDVMRGVMSARAALGAVYRKFPSVQHRSLVRWAEREAKATASAVDGKLDQLADSAYMSAGEGNAPHVIYRSQRLGVALRMSHDVDAAYPLLHQQYSKANLLVLEKWYRDNAASYGVRNCDSRRVFNKLVNIHWTRTTDDLVMAYEHHAASVRSREKLARDATRQRTWFGLFKGEPRQGRTLVNN